MENEESWIELSNISADIFNEDIDTIEFQVQDNVGSTTTFNEGDDFTKKVNDIKNLLDTILQNKSKDQGDNQSDYMNSLFLIELEAFYQKLSEYNSNLNQAINIQQNISMVGDSQLITKPVIVSLPVCGL